MQVEPRAVLFLRFQAQLASSVRFPFNSRRNNHMKHASRTFCAFVFMLKQPHGTCQWNHLRCCFCVLKQNWRLRFSSPLTHNGFVVQRTSPSLHLYPLFFLSLSPSLFSFFFLNKMTLLFVFCRGFIFIFSPCCLLPL